MTTKSEITRRDTKKNINCRYFGDILHVYIILEEMLMLWCLKTWVLIHLWFILQNLRK